MCDNKTYNSNLEPQEWFDDYQNEIRKQRKQKEKSRIDIIGRNGNDGEHYDNDKNNFLEK